MAWALQSGYTVVDYTEKPRNRNEILQLSSLSLNVPAGFFQLAAKGKLSKTNADIIERIVEIQQLTGGRPRSFSAKVDLRTKRRKYDHYWEAFPSLLLSHSTILDFEELLELTLLQFCSYTITPASPCVSLYEASKLKLTAYITTFAELHGASTVETECKIWICMITTYAWRTSTNGLHPQGQLLLTRLLQYPLSKSMEWDKIETVLRKYFWTEDLLDFGKLHWQFS